MADRNVGELPARVPDVKVFEGRGVSRPVILGLVLPVVIDVPLGEQARAPELAATAHVQVVFVVIRIDRIDSAADLHGHFCVRGRHETPGHRGQCEG
jgi:hypothetical protein